MVKQNLKKKKRKRNWHRNLLLVIGDQTRGMGRATINNQVCHMLAGDLSVGQRKGKCGT